MSYVLSIRRAEIAEPFSSSELEHAVAVHPGLVLEGQRLSWSSPKSQAKLTLNVSPRELWTDGLTPQNSAEQTRFLADLARTLDAQLVGEEGEVLFPEPEESALGSAAKSAAGGVLTVLALPFVLVFALVRLPWVLWKLRDRLK
ncbi:MAG TPA: hypothetical protein PLD37_00675 [Usitatibacteraceae bacterium]|nr:hypothetical protein [Usitatibacteraceae bacterium]